MPTWLSILLGVLVSLGIISLIYWTFVQRRIAIVAKKMDYLVEDLIYKSELLSATVESIVKFSNVTDAIQAVMNSNENQLIDIFLRNKELIKEVTTDINKIFKDNKKINDIKK